MSGRWGVLGPQNKGHAAKRMAAAVVNAHSGHDVSGHALGLRHNV